MSYLVLALMIIAVAFLWTIVEQLQDIRAILRIAHADALEKDSEDG